MTSIIRKSLLDKRNYKLISLKNNLRALIIQDPEADSSSASMAVRVGALSDPKEYSGIAHFCEHMLFMGTKKFPTPNYFGEFLNTNNGYSNAFTDIDATVYKFNCSNSSFTKGLEIFSQFFVSPLFDANTVEKELAAIESENVKNLQSDIWRISQLQRSEANENSGYKIFSTGNKSTINPNNNINEPRDVLIKFFNDYYHACRMCLVIDTPFEIEKIEELVNELFSEIKEGDGKEIVFSDPSRPAYDAKNMGKFYVVESISDRTKLKFNWYLECSKVYYKSKPVNFFSNLFGHEAKNSLFSSLLKDNLATALSAGGSDIHSYYNSFSITITLTDKGLSQIYEVVERTLKFIKLIQSQEINKRFFSELQMTSQISFDYKSREEPIDYTEYLSYTIHNYPEEDILTSSYLFDKYDEPLLRKYLDSFTIDNLNIALVTKNPELTKDLDLTEKWYGTRFSKRDIPIEIKQKIENFKVGDTICNHPLGYPDENKFLPKNLELIDFNNSPSEPTQVYSTNSTQIWYKPDTTFKTPKAVLYCQIYLDKSEYTMCDYDSIAYTWGNVIETKLKDIAYMASEADLNFSLNFNYEGLLLKLHGFNDSMKSALKELLESFTNLNANDDKESIVIQLEKQAKEMKNFYFNNPYNQAYSYIDYLKLEPSVTPQQKLIKLNNLKEEKISEFNEFVNVYLKKAKFTWVVHGNISQNDSVEIANMCENFLKSEALSNEKVSSFRIVDQLVNTHYTFLLEAANPKEVNSSICTVFSSDGVQTIRDSMKIKLVEQVLKESFFDSLRTNQGLGYIVQCFLRETRKIPGIVFLVQSNTKSAEFCSGKITEFLKEQLTELKNLSDDKLKEYKDAVIDEKKKKFMSLDEEAVFNFNQIKTKDYIFDIKLKQISEVESITKEEVLETFEKLFVKEIRRLDVQIVPSNFKEEQTNLVNESINKDKENKEGEVTRYFINSVSEYKKRNKLHPDFFIDAYAHPKF